MVFAVKDAPLCPQVHIPFKPTIHSKDLHSDPVIHRTGTFEGKDRELILGEQPGEIFRYHAGKVSMQGFPPLIQVRHINFVITHSGDNAWSIQVTRNHDPVDLDLSGLGADGCFGWRGG